jgi:hypothetical protein
MRRALYFLLIAAMLAGVALTSSTKWGAILAGSSAPSQALDGGLGLPGREVPMMSSPHLPYLGAPHPAYNSVPPTSGPHLSWTAAPGIYREPVADELTVHALEHGHVAILYAPDTPADQIRILEDLARRHPGEVLLAPHPAVTSGLTLTAWTRLQTLDSVAEAPIDEFIQALSGRYVHGWISGERSTTTAHQACACACGAGCVGCVAAGGY